MAQQKSAAVIRSQVFDKQKNSYANMCHPFLHVQIQGLVLTILLFLIHLIFVYAGKILFSQEDKVLIKHYRQRYDMIMGISK